MQQLLGGEMPGQSQAGWLRQFVEEGGAQTLCFKGFVLDSEPEISLPAPSSSSVTSWGGVAVAVAVVGGTRLQPLEASLSSCL